MSKRTDTHLVRNFALRLAFIDGVSSTCTVSQWLHGGEDRLYMITSAVRLCWIIINPLNIIAQLAHVCFCYTLLTFASLGLVSTWDAVICRHHIRDVSMNPNHFQARLPSFLISPLTLRPDVPLVEAALRMATMVKGGAPRG